MLNKKQRENRIIARGEVSGHAHIIVGNDVVITKDKERILVDVGESGATLRHLLETNWVNEGQEVWTEEHRDIKIEKGTYEYIQQIEYDPYEKAIRNVQD